MEKTALITGASSGIGYVFAKKLAAEKTNLVLVARSQEKLEQLAKQLQEQYRIRVDVIVADLSKIDAVKKIVEQTEALGLSIDILINNAGFGTSGHFTSNAASRDHEQIMVNVNAVVEMTHAYLPGMLSKGIGTIINVASVVAFQPVPYMAVYAATKSFVLSFTEALAEEYANAGVQFLALCPGATQTNFFEVAGSNNVGKMRTPEQVVQTAFAALAKGRNYVVDGTKNYLMAQSGRIFPRKMVAKVAGSMSKPKN